MLPAYPIVLASAVADGTALTNTVTATSILPVSALTAIAAGTLQVGSLLKITLRGRISTVVTTPGTLTLDLRLGGVVVSAFGAIALNVTAQTNASWHAEIIARIASIGSGTAATALATSTFMSRAVVGSAAAASGGVGAIVLPDTAPAVGTGFNSQTAVVGVDVFATWSVANAANSIQVHQALLELKL